MHIGCEADNQRHAQRRQVPDSSSDAISGVSLRQHGGGHPVLILKLCMTLLPKTAAHSRAACRARRVAESALPGTRSSDDAQDCHEGIPQRRPECLVVLLRQDAEAIH